ncbi:WBM0748 family T4SS-associated protein [Wolbachia endosymbiont of Folsomia candida]|uniref:WBM0748 family T4SS-associated protein n=1 Tax=Wolbachia endosymbiont of Folsomia candida TaxID=169402 RepID=UPI000AEC4899|nr:hypothetical protein [Wolbachia endosymbiont of Folsomia candida]APR98426.1 hypothetical protein ASM33_04055 [Wolbachia endosymbiont of Folsomia candida]
MSIKNKISELIKQQFTTENRDNYLAYAIHDWAASELSDSIALCIIECGDCQIKYISIAKSFDITTKEIEEGDIVSIKSKIESVAAKEGGEFFELISNFNQSLREQSEASIIQILDSSAEEILKTFCDSPVEKTDSPEYKENNINAEDNFATLPEEPIESNPVSTSWLFPWS